MDSSPEVRLFQLTMDEDELGVLNTLVVKAIYPQDARLQVKTTVVLMVQRPVLDRVLEKMALLLVNSPQNNPHGRTVDAQ